MRDIHVEGNAIYMLVISRPYIKKIIPFQTSLMQDLLGKDYVAKDHGEAIDLNANVRRS